MNSKIIALIASLVILIAGVSLWRTMWPDTGKFDPDPAIGVGQALAEETVTATHDRGKVLAMISASNQGKFGTDHVIWTTFCDELKKHPAVSLETTEVLPNEDGLPGCSTAGFKDILARNPQPAAIVIFTPLPPWSWFQSQGTLPTLPAAKIIVMGGPTFMPKSYYTGYFTNGLLSALIIGRMQSGSDQIADPKTPREKFHNEYKIFTPQNYEALPE